MGKFIEGLSSLVVWFIALPLLLFWWLGPLVLASWIFWKVGQWSGAV